MCLLEAGQVVVLQETHWNPEEAALWAGQFPLARVYSSPCRVGPRGGAQGGVSILVPPCWRVVEVRDREQ
eukprot:11882208-Alexandrium_andersonii.AAC.1